MCFDEVSVGVGRSSMNAGAIRSVSSGRSHAFIGTGFKIVSDAVASTKPVNGATAPGTPILGSPTTGPNGSHISTAAAPSSSVTHVGSMPLSPIKFRKGLDSCEDD